MCVCVCFFVRVVTRLAIQVNPNSEKIHPTSKKVNPSSKKVNPDSEKANPDSKKVNVDSKKINPDFKKVNLDSTWGPSWTGLCGPQGLKLGPSLLPPAGGCMVYIHASIEREKKEREREHRMPLSTS